MMTDQVHRTAYARRECDGCGRGMQPYHPRKTVGEQLLCPMCAQNEGRRMASTPKMVRVAVRHAQGHLNLKTATPEQGVAYFLSHDKPNLIVLAHDSGDSMTIFHCPFCGSGQVIARSDGSVECEFCHAAFTVQVQPEFSAFPQTIGGVPVDVPGMGPDQQAPQDGQEPALSGEDGPPGFGGSSEEEGESEEEDDGVEDDAPPFAKKSYRTEAGHELGFEQYLQHIAITCARDKKIVVAAVRTANGRR